MNQNPLQLAALTPLDALTRAAVALVLAVALVSGAAAQVTTEDATLQEINNPSPWAYGQQVEVDGPWLFVGARGHLNPAVPADWNRGVVYVYRRAPGGWTLTQVLSAPPTGRQAMFGQSIAADGGRLLIGNPSDDSLNPAGGFNWAWYGGRVECYELVNESWVHRQTIDTIYRPGEGFGFQVAVDGDLAIATGTGYTLIGAPWSPGAVHFFRHDGQQWIREQIEFGRQRINYFTNQAGLGYRLALCGDRAAVGARGVTVTLYERANGRWVETLLLERPFPFSTASSNFGEFGLALSDDWIAVGDIERPFFSVPPGVVYMYRRDPLAPGGWRYHETLRASNPSSQGQTSDNFGYDIAIDGDQMIVGAERATASPSQEFGIGQAYVFTLQNGFWVETERLSTERIEAEAVAMGDSSFGCTVAIQDHLRFVGDWLDVTPPNNYGHGALHVYERGAGSPYCAGAGPSLDVAGVAAVMHGGLTATAAGLPAAATGVLVVSRVSAGSAGVAAPGTGLCVGTALRRIAVFQAPGGAQAGEPVALPVAIDTGAYSVGETWAFQVAAFVAGSVVASDAVAVSLR